MRQLVDAAAEALVVVDTDGCVRFANREARKLFGDDALAPGCPAPFPLGAEGETAEFTLQRDDGSHLTLERRAAPVGWDSAPATLYTIRNLSALRSAEEHLVHVNRLYAALAQTSHVCARALSAEDLFEDVCRICVAHGGFRLAWIVRPNADNTEMEIVASAGPALAYLEKIRVRLTPDHPESRGPIAQALRLGIQYVCNDFTADPLTRPWHRTAEAHGLRACAVTPIHTGPTTELALAVHAGEINYFSSDLQTLLKQIADEVASGLERIAARTARRKAEQALVESEARFRQMARVNPQVFWMRDARNDA
ncbi:MAG: PAS domain-containing protein, partial [Verrucomicrobia bacterium]